MSIQQVTIFKQNAAVQLPANMVAGKKYPCIVFFQGIGETGKDWNLMYKNGMGYYMKAGKLNQEAIFIAIQQYPAWASDKQIEATLQEIYAKYPVSTFSLTGLSAGSLAIIGYMGTKKSNLPIYAVVPMSYGTKDYATYNTTAYAGVKVWAFCGTSDKLYYNMKATMAKIPGAKTTWYSGGHSGWNTFYNPDWKENGVSIYDFMLPPVEVVVPAVKVGDTVTGVVSRVIDSNTFEVKIVN